MSHYAVENLFGIEGLNIRHDPRIYASTSPVQKNRS